MNTSHGVLWNLVKGKCVHVKPALPYSFPRLFKSWLHVSNTFGKWLRQELLGDYNANVKQKSNVSHILTVLWRKDMPCQCQWISTSMAICYEPIFWCLSVQPLALKDLNHFQWRSRKQSKPASVKCLRLQCQKCYSVSSEVKLVQSVWL